MVDTPIVCLKSSDTSFALPLILKNKILIFQTLAMIMKGREDEESKVIVTVIFYYTDLFESETPDIKGHIENLLENANLAYLNSKIPLELRYHCIVKVPFAEIPGQKSKERLRQFKDTQRE